MFDLERFNLLRKFKYLTYHMFTVFHIYQKQIVQYQQTYSLKPENLTYTINIIKSNFYLALHSAKSSFDLKTINSSLTHNFTPQLRSENELRNFS